MWSRQPPVTSGPKIVQMRICAVYQLFLARAVRVEMDKRCWTKRAAIMQIVAQALYVHESLMFVDPRAA